MVTTDRQEITFHYFTHNQNNFFISISFLENIWQPLQLLTGHASIKHDKSPFVSTKSFWRILIRILVVPCQNAFCQSANIQQFKMAMDFSNVCVVLMSDFSVVTEKFTRPAGEWPTGFRWKTKVLFLSQNGGTLNSKHFPYNLVINAHIDLIMDTQECSG